MVDLTNLKAPGWQRVVAELTAYAPDDKVFLLRLVGVLAQVAGARQAALFSVQAQSEEAAAGPEVRPTLLWPLPPETLDPHGRMSIPVESIFDPSRIKPGELLHEKEVRAAARSVAGVRQTMIYALEGGDQMYDAAPSTGCVIAVPILAGSPEQAAALPLQGVVTLLVESRSKQALQTTLAMMEVLAGYVFNHTAQQSLRRTRALTQALDLGVRLIASINATDGFKGCALQFVNDLCRQLGLDRVALGWVHGTPATRRIPEGRRIVKAIALSDTENLDRRMLMVQKIEGAMEECLDQGQPVLYPPPPSQGPGSDPVLGLAITHAHRELGARDAKLRIASLPLRVTDSEGERTLGVVLLETGDESRLDVGVIELAQATLDLVAPVLAVRYSDDRMIALRVWDWMLKSAAWAVGPKHTAWKAGAVAATILLLFAAFWKTTYRVGAPMEVQPVERRVISAPFDGLLARVPEGVDAGRDAHRDQLLAEMDTRELYLAAIEAESQVLQYDKESAENLQKGDLAQAQQAKARADQSRARAELMREQIARSRILSPLDGKIINGDIRDKVGASVKLGDPLFEVADLTKLVVIAHVSDNDITYIRPGQTGQVSPKADPSKAFSFTVDRIVPLSRSKNGQNAFEVWATLEPGTGLLPGTEGLAKFNAEKHSLLWIGSRRILDQLRLWLWW